MKKLLIITVIAIAMSSSVSASQVDWSLTARTSVDSTASWFPSATVYFILSSALPASISSAADITSVASTSAGFSNLAG